MDIRIYHFYFLGLILVAMLIYCFLSVVTLTSPVLNYFYYPQMKPSIEREKVLVDLFVMSRCPDAVVCELKEVNDIAIITTDYVANLNDSEKYGVTCKHGELECIECLNQDISLIGTYNHAKKCTNQVLGVTAVTTANITNSADDNYSKKLRCIRDGYWYDCDEGHSVEDFVQSIRKAYENSC
nr:1935_t:CDS:2 [Entrophospora candida]